MDVRADGKGSAWKLCIGLAVVCGMLVFAAGFLHRNAVASAIDAQQTKSVSYVHGKLASAVGNDKMTKELGERAAAHLEKEADVPAGATVRTSTTTFCDSASTRPGSGPAIRTRSGACVPTHRHSRCDSMCSRYAVPEGGNCSGCASGFARATAISRNVRRLCGSFSKEADSRATASLD